MRALNKETRISMPERGDGGGGGGGGALEEERGGGGGAPHSDLTKCLPEELEKKYPGPSIV